MCQSLFASFLVNDFLCAMSFFMGSGFMNFGMPLSNWTAANSPRAPLNHVGNGTSKPCFFLFIMCHGTMPCSDFFKMYFWFSLLSLRFSGKLFAYFTCAVFF